jgi:hypothetical protein
MTTGDVWANLAASEPPGCPEHWSDTLTQVLFDSHV